MTKWDAFFCDWPLNLNNLGYFEDPLILQSLRAEAELFSLEKYQFTDNQLSEILKYIFIQFPDDLIEVVTPIFSKHSAARIFSQYNHHDEFLSSEIKALRKSDNDPSSYTVWRIFLNVVSNNFSDPIENYHVTQIVDLRAGILKHFDRLTEASNFVAPDVKFNLAFLVYRFGGPEKYLKFTNDADQFQKRLSSAQFSMVVNNRAMAFWNLGLTEFAEELLDKHKTQCIKFDSFRYNYGRFKVAQGNTEIGNDLMRGQHLDVDGTRKKHNFGNIQRWTDSDKDGLNICLWGSEGVNDQLVQTLFLGKFVEKYDIRSVYAIVHKKLAPLLKKIYPAVEIGSYDSQTLRVPKKVERHLPLSELPTYFPERFVFSLKVPARSYVNCSPVVGVNWRSHMPTQLRDRGGSNFHFPKLSTVCELFRFHSNMQFLIIQPFLTETEKACLTEFSNVQLFPHSEKMFEDLQFALSIIAKLDVLIAHNSTNATLASMWGVPCCSWKSEHGFAFQGKDYINSLRVDYFFLKRRLGLQSFANQWLHGVSTFLNSIDVDLS